jgi:hypothetical protein
MLVQVGEGLAGSNPKPSPAMTLSAVLSPGPGIRVTGDEEDTNFLGLVVSAKLLMAYGWC